MLHLHRRRVLRLVENDIAVCERAAAHEGERRDLDLARLHAMRDLLGRHHVVQRVVERPQIGVDLFLHVAGQEAQPLAGLDRRTRQHDALDLAAQQKHDGHGDREIGLAAAGGSQREHHVPLTQRRQVAALAGRARLDGALARADALGVAAFDAAARETHGRIDVGALDRQAALQPLVEAGDRLLRDRGVVGRAGDGELIAARAELHVGQLLDAHQIAVVVAVEHGQQCIVVEGHAPDIGGTRARDLVAHAATS
jgi:hypothetical protein